MPNKEYTLEELGFNPETFEKLPADVQAKMRRAAIEARRGIERDDQGRILRTPEWLAQRIAMLLKKRADNEQRIKNIDSEIAGRREELAASGKTAEEVDRLIAQAEQPEAEETPAA